MSLGRASTTDSSIPQAGSGDVQSLSLASLSLASPDRYSALSDTPLKTRVSSYDSDHKMCLKNHTTCRTMGEIFWKEIHPSQSSHATLGKQNFELSKPLSIAKVVLKMTDVYEYKSSWQHELGFEEAEFANWLNKIGELYARATGSTVLRTWTADSCRTPVSDASPATGPLLCKPDIILVNHGKRSHKPSWPAIHAFGKITSQATFHREMEQTLYTKSHVMFSTQESRCFVCSLAVYGQVIRFSVIDREGVLYQTIPIHGGRDDARELIRIVGGLMCWRNVAALGYDPTVKLKSNGSVDTITVADPVPKIYKVVKTVHVATGIIGRCICVWQAYDCDNREKLVVIKDAWPLASRRDLEEKALQRLQGIRGIPVIEQIATVRFARRPQGDSREDSTAETRQFGVKSSSQTRIHRRVVVSSVGLKMQNFRCLSELIGAFRDIIVGEL